MTIHAYLNGKILCGLTDIPKLSTSPRISHVSCTDCLFQHTLQTITFPVTPYYPARLSPRERRIVSLGYHVVQAEACIPITYSREDIWRIEEIDFERSPDCTLTIDRLELRGELVVGEISMRMLSGFYFGSVERGHKGLNLYIRNRENWAQAVLVSMKITTIK